MKFEFATANRIIFGEGTLQEIRTHADRKRVLVITGRNLERARVLLDLLSDYQTFSVSGEPTVQVALDGAAQARNFQAEMVIAIGGGSVLDTGKAVAALATNSGDPYDYLEVIGKGQAIKIAPLPMIAIPTTAGTGSEVTRNAVLASPEHRVKVSMRSPMMLPQIALVDPTLTYDLPPEITAATGMDALTQLIEPYVSVNANPLTDAICAEGIPRAARSLQRAYENENNARSEMALASLFGGLALANAKLGAVHGFAGVIGGMFDAPHGAVCAALLPPVIEMNIRAAREQNNETVIVRYEQVARWLTQNPNATAEDAITWVQALKATLKIQPLRTYGITAKNLPEIVRLAENSSSMKGNPLALNQPQRITILEQAL